MRWITALTLLASLSFAGSEYDRRAAALKPRDVRGHFVLALWCEQQGLIDRAREQYALVLDLEPHHRAAGRALARLRPDAKSLARRALLARRKADREAAVRALRRTKRPARLILPSLRSPSATVRTRAIEALGALDDRDAVAPLIHHLSVAGSNSTGAYIAQSTQVSFIQDYDVEVA